MKSSSTPEEKKTTEDLDSPRSKDINIKNLVDFNKASSKVSKTKKEISNEIVKILDTPGITEQQKLEQIIAYLEKERKKARSFKKRGLRSNKREKITAILKAYQDKYHYYNEEQFKIAQTINELNDKMSDGSFIYADYLILQKLMTDNASQEQINSRKQTSLKESFQKCNSRSVEYMAGSFTQKTIELFTKLIPRDFFIKEFNVKTQSFLDLITYCNNTQDLIANSVLEGAGDNSDNRSRLLTLEQWIRVAYQCKINNPPDLFSASLIYGAINNFCEDLKIGVGEKAVGIKNYLSSDAHQMIEELQELFKMESNYPNYRRFVSNNKNAIPPLYILNTDLTGAGEGIPSGVERDNYQIMYREINKVWNTIQYCNKYEALRKFNPDALLSKEWEKFKTIKSLSKNGIEYFIFNNEDFNGDGHSEIREQIRKKGNEVGTDVYLESSPEELDKLRITATKGVKKEYFNAEIKKINNKEANNKEIIKYLAINNKKTKKSDTSSEFYKSLETNLSLFSIKEAAPLLEEDKLFIIDADSLEELIRNSSAVKQNEVYLNKDSKIPFTEYAKLIYKNIKPDEAVIDPLNQPPYIKALAAIWLLINDSDFFNLHKHTNQQITNVIGNYIDLTILFLDNPNLSINENIKLINLLNSPTINDGKSASLTLIEIIKNNESLPQKIKDKLTSLASTEINSLEQKQVLKNRSDKPIVNENVSKIPNKPKASRLKSHLHRPKFIIKKEVKINEDINNVKGGEYKNQAQQTKSQNKSRSKDVRKRFSLPAKKDKLNIVTSNMNENNRFAALTAKSPDILSVNTDEKNKAPIVNAQELPQEFENKPNDISSLVVSNEEITNIISKETEEEKMRRLDLEAEELLNAELDPTVNISPKKLTPDLNEEEVPNNTQHDFIELDEDYETMKKDFLAKQESPQNNLLPSNSTTTPKSISEKENKVNIDKVIDDLTDQINVENELPPQSANNILPEKTSAEEKKKNEVKIDLSDIDSKLDKLVSEIILDTKNEEENVGEDLNGNKQALNQSSNSQENISAEESDNEESISLKQSIDQGKLDLPQTQLLNTLTELNNTLDLIIETLTKIQKTLEQQQKQKAISNRSEIFYPPHKTHDTHGFNPAPNHFPTTEITKPPLKRSSSAIIIKDAGNHNEHHQGKPSVDVKPISNSEGNNPPPPNYPPPSPPDKIVKNTLESLHPPTKK